MRLVALTLALVLACAGAGAQTPGPDPAANAVIAHYRAYVAAYARDDIDTARNEAAKALAASEARDGDGGRTAVLAFNLARLYAQYGPLSEAKAPAARALELAGNAGSGVDPLAARVLSAHIALMQEEQGAADSLHDDLLAAAEREDLDRGIVLDASSALGRVAMAQENWRRAAFAWRLAGLRTIGDEAQRNYKRATALVWESGARLALDEYQLSYDAITEAVKLMAPLAPETSGPEASSAEIDLGATLAWRAAIKAKMLSENLDKTEPLVDLGRAALEGQAPLCDVVIQPRPAPRYPSKDRNAFAVGGVSVRLQIDASGQVTGARLLAVSAGGDSDFGAAVLKVADQWRAVAGPKSPPGCRMQTDSHIQTVSFVLR